MKHLKSRDKLNEWDYCETSTLTSVSEFIDTCRKCSEMGLIIGAPGTGKSTAIDYAKMHFNGGYLGDECQFILTVGSDASSEHARHFLEELSECIESDMHGSAFAYQRLRAIKRFLHNHGGESVIVVDEAQKLGRGSLETLREIFDATGVGIVLIGNQKFKTNFQTQKLGQYSHIASRITRRLPDIQSVSEADFILFCSDYMGVTDKKALDALRPYKDGAGGLRHVARIIDQALDALDDPAKIDMQEVKDAVLVMGLDA